MEVAANIQTVRRFYDAGPADDDQRRLAFASPDVVWHVPGENRISGRYAGHEAVFGTMPGSMAPLDQWTVDVIDLMGNADLVVARVHVRGRRLGRSVDTFGAHVFRLDDEARIVEAWGFTADQAALDALLDPEAPAPKG
jgi:ketosteroid isomerase-like protein